MNRPIGVTIIAILTVIGGLLLLFGGISFLGVGALFSIASTTETPNGTGEDAGFIGPVFGIFFLLIGGVFLIIRIVHIVMSYGLWKGRGWAWTITIIITMIGIAIQVISGITNSIFTASITDDTNSSIFAIISPIIVIAINALILYYLYRPHVKVYFGKNSQASRT